MPQKSVKPASQMTDNWAGAMANPQTATKYGQGIDRVTTSPMEAAASGPAQALYLQRTAEAVNSGRMAQKLRASDFGAWKTQAKTMGATGLARGASKGKAKIGRHFQEWQPTYQAASDAAQNLPKGGFANAQARWAASVQVMMAKAGRS